MFISRWLYYISSIPTLLLGVKNWPAMLVAFAGLQRTPFVVELRNGERFKVRNRMDVWIVKETCLDRDYESASVDLQEDWIVLDIGAGLGDFSVHAAKRCPRGMVYAYEPFPESFALLEENARLNGLQNVRMFSQAVGKASGKMTLYATGEAVQHRAAQAADSAAAPAIEVPSVTLEQVFAELPKCDFLKIDCEGAEYEILFNASDSTLVKARHICLEYHDGVTRWLHGDLAEFLRSKGFRVRLRPNPAHEHLGFLWAEKMS